MRTNIEIDDALMEQAMKLSGAKTKKAAVADALQRMVQVERQAGILKLRGKIEFWDDVIADRQANSVISPRKTKEAA